MKIDLSTKRVVVTGVTRGIGRAIATLFKQHGAYVIGTGTKLQQQHSELPCDRYFPADFSKLDDIKKFAKELTRLKVDILVNNAGINKIAPYSDITVETFQEIQQVNVVAPFMFSQAVLSNMRENQWGRIVHVGSIWGIIGKELRASYCASKFALDGITVALSAEVAGDNILVNSVAPGFTDTELTRSILGNEQIEKITAQIPLGRLAQVGEVANFVVWLASVENTYITGQNIAIDGGFTRV